MAAATGTADPPSAHFGFQQVLDPPARDLRDQGASAGARHGRSQLRSVTIGEPPGLYSIRWWCCRAGSATSAAWAASIKAATGRVNLLGLGGLRLWRRIPQQRLSAGAMDRSRGQINVTWLQIWLLRGLGLAGFWARQPRACQESVTDSRALVSRSGYRGSSCATLYMCPVTAEFGFCKARKAR
jgi:hypothetical protein